MTLTAIEHNRKLVEELLNLVDHHQSGLFMDYELLTKAVEIGAKVQRPNKGDIDPQTGLSYQE